MAYAFNDDKSKFNLKETIDNVDSLIGNMAVIETSPVITNHSTGEYIMYNGTLLKVLSPIATGENLVLGTNVTPINFGDEMKVLQDSLNIESVSLPANYFNGGNTIVVYKSSHVVSVHLSSLKNVPANTDVILFTLPSGYRPVVQIVQDVKQPDGQSVRYTVNPDGNVIAYYYANSTAALINIKATLTWLTA